MQFNLTKCCKTHLWTSVKSKISRGRNPQTPNLRLARLTRPGRGVSNAGGKARGRGGRGRRGRRGWGGGEWREGRVVPLLTLIHHT